MTTALDTLAARKTAARERAVAGLRRFAKVIADDRDNQPDAGDIDELLREAGWSIDQFRNLVHQLQRSNTLQQQLAETDDLEAERERIDEILAEADVEFRAAQEKHNQTVGPLMTRRRQISDTTARRNLVERELEAAKRSIREQTAAE